MPTATKTKPKTAHIKSHKSSKHPVTKTAGDIFEKVRSKTGISQKKIDAWQTDWLAMPKTRKKYKHLKDAPQIVGEEALAMTNDIMNFIQGKEGGNSNIFKEVKSEMGEFTHAPKHYLKDKYNKGRELAKTTQAKVQKGITKAEKTIKKIKVSTEKAQKKINKKKF